MNRCRPLRISPKVDGAAERVLAQIQPRLEAAAPGPALVAMGAMW